MYISGECGQCDSSVVALQYDPSDANFFCRPCWNGIGKDGPNPRWWDNTPVVVCTRSQSFAADHLRPWMRCGGGGGGGGGGGSGEEPRGEPREEPLVLGFDIEWRPNFVKGEAPNRTALLQLARTSQAGPCLFTPRSHHIYIVYRYTKHPRAHSLFTPPGPCLFAPKLSPQPRLFQSPSSPPTARPCKKKAQARVCLDLKPRALSRERIL